jgi:hypothetical protein
MGAEQSELILVSRIKYLLCRKSTTLGTDADVFDV